MGWQRLNCRAIAATGADTNGCPVKTVKVSRVYARNARVPTGICRERYQKRTSADVRPCFPELLASPSTRMRTKGESNRVLDETLNRSWLHSVEVFTEDLIYQIRLRNFQLVGGSLGQLLVSVSDDQRLVFVWKSPRTDAAIEATSLTGVTLGVIALLAQWLPIAKIIGTVSRPRNPMVGAELDGWLFGTTRSAFVTVLVLKLLPIAFIELCAWLTLLADTQTLQLVAGSLLDNRSESLLPLQFPHSAKDIFVIRLSIACSKGIDCGANIVFAKRRPGDAVAFRPQRSQDYCVVKLVRWAQRDEACFGFNEPFLPTRRRLVWQRSGGYEKTFACARTRHVGMGS